MFLRRLSSRARLVAKALGRKGKTSQYRWRSWGQAAGKDSELDIDTLRVLPLPTGVKPSGSGFQRGAENLGFPASFDLLCSCFSAAEHAMRIRIEAGRLLALTFFLSSPCWAQLTAPPPRPTIIRGFVRDAETHEPLQHVVVTLEKQTSGFVAQAETDGLGKFTFEGPGQDLFTVTIRPLGYQELSQRIDLRTATTQYVSLEPRRIRKQAAASVPPEGPASGLNARDALIPENARKEFNTAQELLLKSKDLQGSAEHLHKAIKIYPSFADAYVLLAMVHMEDSKVAEARSALEKAIEIDPKSADAHLALGMLLNHEKDYPAAEKSLIRALELNPDAPQGHYELAKTYWAVGRWQDAEPHVQKAASLQPDMAPAHVLLGNIALRKHDNQNALKEFREYLRLDPNGPMAAAVHQIVDKIERAPSTP
jgi:Tfp pilus assembly protein PilF